MLINHLFAAIEGGTVTEILSSENYSTPIVDESAILSSVAVMEPSTSARLLNENLKPTKEIFYESDESWETCDESEDE